MTQLYKPIKLLPYIFIIQTHHIIYQMQANCCIFPSPSQYQLNNILNKIVLIPKTTNNPPVAAQYYFDKYIRKTENYDNQFTRYVGYRNQTITSNNTSTDINSLNNANNKKFQVYSISLKQKAQKLTHIIKNSPIVLQQKYNQTNTTKAVDQIPCLFLPSARNDKIFIFFHGNGEDITSGYQFATFINRELDITVLAIEYQGYSVYDGNSTPNNIVQDSKMVIEYLLSLGYQKQDIILFGRSIGGAIAFEIASHYETCCLILLSPFLSLKKVAEDLYGKVASTLLKQTLDNASKAQNVKCPILIIHGLKDTLVPFHHSISILKQCKGYTRLKLAQNMTHTKFNFNHDFIQPVIRFINDLKLRKI